MSQLYNSIMIDQTSPTPAYRQLYLAIRSQIEIGQIPPDTRLPALRTLAAELHIARNTVEAAYRQLKTEGYVRSKRGSGYVVENLDFSVLAAKRSDSTQADDEARLAESELLGRDPLGPSFGCIYNFSYGNRSAGSFPSGTWRTLVNEVLGNASSADANAYSDPFGLPSLRRQLASWLAKTRECHCRPEQIIVQPGTQPALRNLSMLFARDSRAIAFEDPGYDGARQAFVSQRCKLENVPVHRGYDAFLDALEKSRSKLVFVTPSSQFPLGMTMPLSARLRLIDWAVRKDAYIVEDDFCCEYRYDNVQPLPSLQSLDTQGRVIYMGTVSKILSPALRITYLILPPALISRWNDTFQHDFCAVPWLEQEVLARFMATDAWRQYVHRTINMYHARHDTLMKCLNREFGNAVDILGASTGLHMLVGTCDGRPSKMLVELARQNSVRVYETNNYWASEKHPLDNYVLIGYSSIVDGLIPSGIAALRRAWIE